MQFKLTSLRPAKILYWSLCFLFFTIFAMVLGYILGAYRIDPPPAAPAAQKTSPSYTFLRIDSNLNGVSIHGDPVCDSIKSKQTTPYYCKLSSKGLSTTLVADMSLEKDGKQYHFLTWDGCDYSSESKNVCMVSGRLGGRKSVRATYAEGTAAKQPFASSKPDKPSTPTETPKVPVPECTPWKWEWDRYDAQIIAHFNPDYLRDQAMYYCIMNITDVPTVLTVEGGAAPFSQVFVRCMYRGTILTGGACIDPLGNNGSNELMTQAIRISTSIANVIIGQPMYVYEPHATTHSMGDPTYIKWGLDVSKITVTAQANDPGTTFAPYRYTIKFPGKIICSTVPGMSPVCE